MRRLLLTALLMTLTPGSALPAHPDLVGSGLIDDFASGDGRSHLGTRWRLATDQVMGGRSEGAMTIRALDGRPALCLTGDVSLANNGGFVQMHLDLAADGDEFDARRYAGVRLVVRGNGARYNLHLKTSATALPWQSYRATFSTGPAWREVRLPFADFAPYRLVPVLEPRRLRRLGIVAIGEAMQAEICVAEVGFYSE